MAGRKVLIASAAGLWLFWQVDISTEHTKGKPHRRSNTNMASEQAPQGQKRLYAKQSGVRSQ
jgi:hypothetical protein